MPCRVNDPTRLPGCGGPAAAHLTAQEHGGEAAGKAATQVVDVELHQLAGVGMIVRSLDCRHDELDKLL